MGSPLQLAMCVAIPQPTSRSGLRAKWLWKPGWISYKIKTVHHGPLEGRMVAGWEKALEPVLLSFNCHLDTTLI